MARQSRISNTFLNYKSLEDIRGKTVIVILNWRNGSGAGLK